MPYFSLRASPRSARGPEAMMDCGSISFCEINPAIMASAIAPEPIKAMVVLENIALREKIPNPNFQIPKWCVRLNELGFGFWGLGFTLRFGEILQRESHPLFNVFGRVFGDGLQRRLRFDHTVTQRGKRADN